MTDDISDRGPPSGGPFRPFDCWLPGGPCEAMLELAKAGEARRCIAHPSDPNMTWNTPIDPQDELLDCPCTDPRVIRFAEALGRYMAIRDYRKAQ